MPSPAAAEVVLLCRKLTPCIDFFVDAGFRLDSIFPADDPRRARLSGHGLRLCLERRDVDGGGHLRIPGDRTHETTAPNGAVLEFVAATARPRPTWQPATFVVRPADEEQHWITGRAGLLYRDLISGRQDGWLVASRIRVERGGPVQDYVHFHRVTAQIIYCRTGSVRVVYENQGEPFDMIAGDCVLQPPGIRHRVLECSADLEVVEVSSPAEHATGVDHELELPNARIAPDEPFGGQRFRRHEGHRSVLQPWDIAGFDCRDTGIGQASNDVVAVRIVRPADAPPNAPFQHSNDRRFWFVLRGELALQRGAATHRLERNAAGVLPPNETFHLSGCTPDLELLEVALNHRALA